MEETDRQMDTRQFHRPCSALLCQQLLVLLHLFNCLFSRTTWVSRYQKGKTSLDLNEARDDGVLGCSSISWTICKQPALHSRQITTPTPHHSIFTGRMLFKQQCQSIEGNEGETSHPKLKKLINNLPTENTRNFLSYEPKIQVTEKQTPK